MRILLVEDEPNAARMLAKGLREQSYAVDIAADGEAALYQLNVYDYDLMILDVMLPHKDGLQVCREMRGLGLSTPVLMLTARDAVDDRIAGLDAGADDYLIKPFDFGELLARARALLRRGDTVQSEILRVADLEVNTRSRTVRRGESRIQLSAKEYALVEYFARNADRVLGRADIAEHVWDKNFDIFSNLIEVYVQRLRRKIDDGHAVKLFHTRRGEGYALTSNEDPNV